MKLTIRMDDISPDMDWERFMAFKALLDTYGIRPLIGVVPDNQDENLHKTDSKSNFWDYIKELQEGGWVIALHGSRHVYTTKRGGLFPLNHFSEFAGVPLEKQKAMLKQGTEIMRRHGIETDIFMAPAHSYDRNTLLALRENGYTKMTDGFGNGPYKWKGMIFYPISFLQSRSLKKKTGITTLVVHTNELQKQGIEQYQKLFEAHKQELLSYDEYLKEPVKNRGILGRFGEYVLAVGKHYLVKLKR
ncbi:MAG: DUF2334 domain-containing protein [Lachnospiraceae bacterium]|nr:DUF2334 domain-containing protein [Lachnospiraceae bacterium]